MAQRRARTSERRLFPSDSSWRPEAPPDLSHVKEVALDFESTGLAWWGEDVPTGVSVAWQEGDRIRTQYLPTRHAGGNLDEDVVKRWGREQLAGKYIYNASMRFDAHMGRKWGWDFEEMGCTISDVVGWVSLLDDSRRNFTLESIGQDYLGEGKVKGLDVGRMSDYHAGEVYQYAEQDVALDVRLKNKLWPLLEQQNLHQVRQLEDDVIFPVIEMERNGTIIDEELLDKWLVDTERQYVKLLWEVHEATGIKPEPDSPACWEKLFRQRGLAIQYYTEHGRPSFSDEALKHVDDPVVQSLRRAGQLKDLRVKFLVKYSTARRPDGLLGYSLHPLRTTDGGTISGRFSSTGMTSDVGVNIQQVGGKKQLAKQGADYPVRRLFIAEPGHLFLDADAKQIEYRLFAHYANSEAILSQYRLDPETDFHNMVWSMLKELVSDITRERTKDINFAAIYGAGLHKLALMMGISESAAVRFYNAYRQRFPEAEKLLHKAMDTAEKRGYVKTALGRRSRFPLKKRLHKALNAVIQGTAADVMKRKLVELHRRRKQTGLKLRFTVHDSAAGTVPDVEAARRVKEVLDEQTTPFRVPILWDVKVGPNWADGKPLEKAA